MITYYFRVWPIVCKVTYCCIQSWSDRTCKNKQLWLYLHLFGRQNVTKTNLSLFNIRARVNAIYAEWVCPIYAHFCLIVAWGCSQIEAYLYLEEAWGAVLMVEFAVCCVKRHFRYSCQQIIWNFRFFPACLPVHINAETKDPYFCLPAVVGYFPQLGRACRRAFIRWSWQEL
jgi:hypothetical protein